MNHAGYLTDLSMDELLDTVKRLGGRPFQGRMLSRNWLLENAAQRYLQHIEDPQVAQRVNELLEQVAAGGVYDVILGAYRNSPQRMDIGAGLSDLFEQINPREENPGWRSIIMFVNRS